MRWTSLLTQPPFVSDVSEEEDTEAFVTKIKKDFPALSIIVNNAAQACLYDLAGSENAFKKAQDEI